MAVGTPHLLLDQLVFGEGPRWYGGKLWFSDMHAHEVVAVDLEGRREAVLTLADRPSGLGFLPDGRLLVVSMDERKLLRRERDGLVVHADLSALARGCNDMVVDGQGRAYAGNVGFRLFVEPYQSGGLILVTPDGAARTVAEAIEFPNGTVVTPDGKTLIVAESRGQRLTAFDIKEDGSLANRRVWAQLETSADGICLDAEGCVWVANPRPPGGFFRVAEGGAIRDRVDSGAFLGIACALGGPDRRTLFLLEARTTRPEEMKGRENARIRAVEVEVPGAGWP